MNDQTGHPDQDELDEVRLRDALVMIGDEAAKDHPEADQSDGAPPYGSPPPSRWRRWRRWKTTAAASAAAAAIVGIAVLEVATDTDTGPDKSTGTATRDLSDAQEIACARSIVEGTVVAVRPAASPIDVRMTIDVTDWIKPAHSDKNTLTFLTPSAADKQQKPFRTGERVFVTIRPPRISSSALLFRARYDEAGYARRDIERALPEATHTKCPPWWRRPS